MTWTQHADGWRRSVAAPEKLVIVLHGYSRSGEIIKNNLGQPLSDALPAHAFFAPDGFEPYEGGDYVGRQWFSRTAIDDAVRLQRIEQLYPRLRQLIDDELARVGLGPEQLVLTGFSQGAILTQHHAIVSPQRNALALAYSGRAATPPAKGADRSHRSGTPILAVYGRADQQLAGVEHSAAELQAAGYPFTLHLLDDVAHVVTQEGIDLGIAAIRAA